MSTSYDNKDLDFNDTYYGISKSSTKEDDLFNCADVPSYLKISKKFYDYRDKDDYEKYFTCKEEIIELYINFFVKN